MNTRTPGTPGISRRTLLGGALAAAATLGTGCSARERPRRAGPLIWATGRLNVAAAGKVADLWNTSRPAGPLVRVEPLPAKSDDQRRQLELELGAELDTVDVLDLDVIWTGQFAERGWLRRLDDLQSELDGVTLQLPLGTARWDGSLWAAPYKTDVGLLFYRTDLLPDGPPRTWEELAEQGVQDAPPGGAAFVADGQQFEGLTVRFLEYLWSAGGELLGPDARTVLLDDAPARRALEHMANGYTGGLSDRGYPDLDQRGATNVFRSGRALFLRAWPDAFRTLDEAGSPVAGKVAPALLPTFADRAAGRSTPALGGGNLAVSSCSSRADEALEFVRYVATSPQVAAVLDEERLLSTLRAAYAAPAGDPLSACVAEAMSLARPRPASPVWPAVSEEIQQQVHAACTGRRTVGAAVDELRTVLTSITEDR